MLHAAVAVGFYREACFDAHGAGVFCCFVAEVIEACAGVQVVARVVVDAPVAVEYGALLPMQHLLAVVAQSDELSVVHVEGCFYLVVFDAEVAEFFHVAFQGMVAGSVGLDGWQGPWALPKGKLFAGYDVSGGCPVATVFQADFVGDVVVGRVFQQGLHRCVYGASFTGRAVGQAESLFFDEVSVAFQAVVQVAAAWV